VAAWGQNFYGALGNGTTSNSSVPVAVNTAGVLAGKNVVSVSGGSSRSLALCSDGTLTAWGTNNYGQAGNGSTASSNVPVAVSTDTLGAGEKFTVGTGAQSASHSLGIVAAPCLPMLVLEQAGGMRLTSGRSTVDFGSFTAGNEGSQTFTIRNYGFLPLSIDNVTIDGSNAAEFVITTPPASSVAPGSTTTFTVTFTAGSPFGRRAVLHIASNDPITSAFQVDLAATCRGVLVAVYNTGAEIPLSIGGFTASGNTVDFTLNYTPATGTHLMVVKNTGLNFISGTFDNLAQGQVVVLSYGGAPYYFVANYYGGSGNDLVLQWAATRPFAWGSNSSGMLGNGSTTQSNLPVGVNVTGVLAGKTLAGVAAGGSHTLALGMDGTLAAWGNNDNGQLGNGNTTFSNVPVAVNTAGALSGKTVIAVAAGDSHSLALCSDGTLAAWGYNFNGQLGNGNGTTLYSSVPVAVNTAGVLAGKTVVAVAAGGSHSLALCADGTLAAWGYNYYGQLGNGGTSQSNVPVAVSTAGALAGKAVIALAAGSSFSLALCYDGTLASWGYNNNGQLGNGSTTQSNVPVAVSIAGVLADKTIVAVAAGSSHVIALCADGTLAAWGSNSSGQLGNDTTTPINVPEAVSKTGVLAGKPLVAVAAGGSHSLALCVDGTLAAWGYNYYGQLGNGTSTSSNVPVAVNRAVLAAGEIFVAAINATSNSSIGMVATPYAPRLVVEQPAGTALTGGLGAVDMGSSALGTGVARTFTIRNTGNAPLAIESVTIDGANAADFILTTQPAASVAAGATTTFVVTFTTTTAFARRAALHVTSNDSASGVFHVNLTATGQGLLTATYDTGAEVPLTTSGFTATGSDVNLTLHHTPATGATLTVVKNTGMGFINGNFSNLTQGQVVALNYAGVSYKFVANYYGGSGKDLVLQWATTRPYAWGYNSNGQLGNGGTLQSNVPVAVSTAGVLAGKTITAVATGASHSLALCADGTLAAWGYNYSGQLGNGTTASSKLPVAVSTAGVLAGKTVIAVAAGSEFSLALCSDGTLAAWGNNSAGQLGNGGAVTGNLPVAVSTAGILAGKAVIAVAAGSSHSLALCADGTLAAWGTNSSGQLGNGSTTSQANVPVAVFTAGVLAGKTVTAVSAGQAHSLALCADGTLAAWGTNYFGQLGDGTSASSSLPVAVSTAGVLAGKTITAAAAGYSHSLALCADGTLVAWGSDYWGMLGDAPITSDSNVPVLVDQTGVLSGKTVTTVAAGKYLSMVLCADGTLATWGMNEYGMLGNGSGNSSIPLPSAVTMAYCGVGERFMAGACGQYSSHNLGIAAVPPSPQIAVEQPAGADLVSGSSTVDFAGVFKGAATSLVFTLKNQRGGPLTVSSVTFDGANGPDFYLSQAPLPVFGGTSTTFVVSFAPTALGNRTAVMHIASNDALASTFDINLTGTGGTDSILTAFYTTGSESALVTDSFTATGATVDFALHFTPAAGAQLMVVNNTGLGFIRGRFANLAQGQNVPLTYAGTTYNFVANYYGGSGNDLVLQWAAARPVAWGNNAYGQLGNDTTTRSAVPFEVKTSGVLAAKTIIAVATGSSHSLALCADGTVATWGYNTYGQLGCGNATSSTTPVAVSTAGVLTGKTVVAVAAGGNHSMGLCSDGTLATWGSNSNSQ
jgi:alpha-tubulin suppressor-like RCC1 family protein